MTALLFMIVAGIQATTASASTNAYVPGYCDSSVGYNLYKNLYHPFGTDAPIVLVHGWGGNKKQQWGDLSNSGDFISKLDATDRVSVAAEFEYESGPTYDVLYRSHAKPLAYTIDCMAEISRHNGGMGKVIVVGYSEGAAIARRALNKTVNGRSVASEVGQVVTIADASHYYPAPGISGTVMVHAIAGNIMEQKYNAKGKPMGELKDKATDGRIRTNWATWQYSENTSQGGGSTLVKCIQTTGESSGKPIPASDTSCQHGVLLKNTRVQDDAIAAINRYIVFLNPTPKTRSWTLNKLTVRLDDRWGDIESAMPDISLEGSVFDDTGNVMQIARYDWWCNGTAQDCSIGNRYSIPAPVVSIGGRTPDFSASYSTSSISNEDYDNVWCFSSEKICIYYHGENFTGELQPSPALLDVFASATWAP